MEGPREAIERLARERGVDFSRLSRLLGRNAAYIQQFVRRGVPKKLDEDDRRLLAEFFGVSETMLGARDGTVPPSAPARLRRTTIAVPMLRGVGASAGPGALDDGAAIEQRDYDAAWLRRLSSNPDDLAQLAVQGDSMRPTLEDGDELFIDRRDVADRLRDGIYVLRLDGALNVKRLAINPATRSVSILSENPAHPDFRDCDPARIELVGRVVFIGRAVR